MRVCDAAQDRQSSSVYGVAGAALTFRALQRIRWCRKSRIAETAAEFIEPLGVCRASGTSTKAICEISGNGDDT